MNAMYKHMWSEFITTGVDNSPNSFCTKLKKIIDAYFKTLNKNDPSYDSTYQAVIDNPCELRNIMGSKYSIKEMAAIFSRSYRGA